MPYDRQWLRDQQASYLRDSTLGEQADVFIDLAARKISALLESKENELTSTWSIGAFPYSLPGGVNNIRSITHQNNQYDVALKVVPLHMIGNYSGGGYPQVYAIKGDQLYVGPEITGDYTVTYWRDVTLGDDAGATEATLTRYPSLWLGACLGEAYLWKQDGEMANYYEQRNQQALQWINTKSRELGQGDVPAMRMS